MDRAPAHQDPRTIASAGASDPQRLHRMCGISVGTRILVGRRYLDVGQSTYLVANSFVGLTIYLMARLSHPTPKATTLCGVGWDQRTLQVRVIQPSGGLQQWWLESRWTERRPTRIRVPWRA